MHYLYTGELEPTEDIVVELLQLANEYDTPRAKDICSCFIEGILGEDNVAELFQVACIYNAAALQGICAWVCHFCDPII